MIIKPSSQKTNRISKRKYTAGEIWEDNLPEDVCVMALNVLKYLNISDYYSFAMCIKYVLSFRITFDANSSASLGSRYGSKRVLFNTIHKKLMRFSLIKNIVHAV